MQDFIVNTLILVVVGFVIRTQLYSRKNKSNEKSGCFSIQYNTTLKLIIIINLLFVLFLLIVSAGNLLGMWKFGQGINLGWTIFFGLYFVFPSFASFLGINVWKITVEKEKIIYRDYFGLKHTYNFKDILVEFKKNGKLVAMKNGKKIFTIDNNLDSSRFVESAARYGVLKLKQS